MLTFTQPAQVAFQWLLDDGYRLSKTDAYAIEFEEAYRCIRIDFDDRGGYGDIAVTIDGVPLSDLLEYRGDFDSSRGKAPWAIQRASPSTYVSSQSDVERVLSILSKQLQSLKQTALNPASTLLEDARAQVLSESANEPAWVRAAQIAQAFADTGDWAGFVEQLEPFSDQLDSEGLKRLEVARARSSEVPRDLVNALARANQWDLVQQVLERYKNVLDSEMLSQLERTRREAKA